MNIETDRLYTYTVNNLSFGNIPLDELINELSSGRICGVLLERDLAYRFTNLSKIGCGQGSGQDLMLNGTDTVQCKTVQLGKSIRGRGKNKTVDLMAEIGWTTKSGLWDSKRGKKRNASEWDAEHEAYMQKYDFFLYMNIENFPTIQVILVRASRLSGRDETEIQGNNYHFGKRNSTKTQTCPPPQWNYPIFLTRGMWEEFRGNQILDVTEEQSTD